jgi:hypothetical protein
MKVFLFKNSRILFKNICPYSVTARREVREAEINDR